jgi:hypothetical protein
MEIAINSNYRDAQVAQYAVLGGLQEARDRIQPSTHNIVAPTSLPSLSAANVIYVLNPRSGETVAPWDMTNKYADTELCQERILGLTGSWGVPCSTIASGSAWYSVVNNSLSSSGALESGDSDRHEMDAHHAQGQQHDAILGRWNHRDFTSLLGWREPDCVTWRIRDELLAKRVDRFNHPDEPGYRLHWNASHGDDLGSTRGRNAGHGDRHHGCCQ